jgi:hypothetical protein
MDLRNNVPRGVPAPCSAPVPSRSDAGGKPLTMNGLRPESCFALRDRSEAPPWRRRRLTRRTFLSGRRSVPSCSRTTGGGRTAPARTRAGREPYPLTESIGAFSVSLPVRASVRPAARVLRSESVLASVASPRPRKALRVPVMPDQYRVRPSVCAREKAATWPSTSTTDVMARSRRGSCQVEASQPSKSAGAWATSPGSSEVTPRPPRTAAAVVRVVGVRPQPDSCGQRAG